MAGNYRGEKAADEAASSCALHLEFRGREAGWRSHFVDRPPIEAAWRWGQCYLSGQAGSYSIIINSSKTAGKYVVVVDKQCERCGAIWCVGCDTCTNILLRETQLWHRSV